MLILDMVSVTITVCLMNYDIVQETGIKTIPME